MPYVINNTNGTQTFYVGDQEFNTQTALSLPGRNVPDYGEPIDTNFIQLLENFANDTPPQSTTILTGQLWYDTSDGIFKVYDGTNWVQTGRVPVSELPPSGIQVEGNFYFDESIQKAKVYYQNTWYDSAYAGEISTSFNSVPQGEPSLYGARIRNIFLKRQSDSRDVPVLAITQSYNGSTSSIVEGTIQTRYGLETLIGLFSRNETFTAMDVTTNSEEEALNFWSELNDPGGIGITIKPGLNMRKDSTAEFPIASLAQRAQTSYNLNLGSYGADGANIAAANVFRHDADSLPVANLTYDLGSSTNVFAEAWVNDVYLSNALLGNGSNVTIGTDSNPIENVYVTNIEIDGNLLIEGEVTIGSNTSPVAGIYVEELFVDQTLSIGNVDNDINYVFPDSRAGNSRLVCDDDGQLYWLSNGALYTDIVPEAGITITTDIDSYGFDTNIINREATIGAKIGNGLKFDANSAIEINFADISTCDIQEGTGCDSLYFTNERVFEMLKASVDPSNVSGLEANETGPDDYQLRIHGGPQRVVGTINTASDSPISIIQNRTNTDNYGFGIVEIDFNLGPEKQSDGITGIPAGTGLKNTNGEIGLDWLGVADNLYTNDVSKVSNLTGGLVGQIGIARVNNPESSDPATHLLYVKSIDTIGGGSVDNLVFRNRDNQMVAGSGLINFGASNYNDPYYWKVGYRNADSPKFNSQGAIWHKGNMHLLADTSNRPGSLSASGDVTAFRVTQTSDERLKKNISTIENGLQKVNEMRGVSYKLKRDDTDHVGVIAQEIEKIVPEVVTDDTEGMKSVNYGALVGVLIEAVKELAQEVETLKAKLGD